MAKYSKSLQPAFSLIEVLLAVAILGVFALILVSGFISGQENEALATKRNQATFLAHEGIQAARAIRDSNFAAVTVANHGLTTTGGVWSFSGTSDVTTVNGVNYSRQVAVTNVSTNVQQVVSTVTWTQNLQRNGTVSMTSYVSNWHRTTASGWSTPAILGSLQLPNGNSGVALARNGATMSLVRAAGSVDLASVNITTPSAPTYITDTNITNSATGIAYYGNYVLVTTSSNSQEVLIYDLSNPAVPSAVTTVNLPGNADGQDILVNGHYAYVARSSSSDPELVVLDLTNIASPTTVGTLELTDDANKMSLYGNTLYIASNTNDQELQIVNVTSPAAPALLGAYDATGNIDAVSVGVNATYAMIGRSNGTTLLINITNPATPTLTGSYDATATVNDIIIDNNTVFMATSSTTAELQVVDITTPATPVLLGSSNRPNALIDLIYDSGTSYLYALSNNSPSELVIFNAP